MIRAVDSNREAVHEVSFLSTSRTVAPLTFFPVAFKVFPHLWEFNRDCQQLETSIKSLYPQLSIQEGHNPNTSTSWRSGPFFPVWNSIPLCIYKHFALDPYIGIFHASTAFEIWFSVLYLSLAAVIFMTGGIRPVFRNITVRCDSRPKSLCFLHQTALPSQWKWWMNSNGKYTGVWCIVLPCFWTTSTCRTPKYNSTFHGTS